jgi:hypothetical protein
MNKVSFKPLRQNLTLIVDLEERGMFYAHVENQNGKTVFAYSNEGENGWPDEDGLWIVNDGFMKHATDTEGLLEYLRDLGIATKTATLSLAH